MSKVFVGLSGGVDSAVSAALLKEAGHDVTGIFAKIAIKGLLCPAAEDRRDAMRVAAHLSIPFREIDLSKEYTDRVLKSALTSYTLGETPNPDVLCNREIKFGLMYDYCMSEGADCVATGHYAQLAHHEGRTLLYAGTDPSKDQSYFLWDVPEERLAKTLFPVGALLKSRVRELAQQFGLPNAGRKDSQGLCFLGDISLDDLLIQKLSPKQGDVLDESGRVIGEHRGALLYTIGQRHGFVAHAQTAGTSPLYVIGKDLDANTITVSAVPISDTAAPTTILMRETNWIGPAEGGSVSVRFRYRQTLLPAQLAGDLLSVELASAQHVPVGQSLVVYNEHADEAAGTDRLRCLGGGIITGVLPR